MLNDTPVIADPLPHRYLTADEPGIGGTMKVRPEDFLVEEVPLYDPCGEGEHLYLQVQKTFVSHGELISCVRRHFNVRDYSIGFAGMKDKMAVTRQTISVHLPHATPPDVDLGHDRIQVISAGRHTNKIRLGHLAGNRFSIRIRDVDPGRVAVAAGLLRRLADGGAPNYFDRQRFGYRVNNHLLGAAQLREDWPGLLAELLGSTGSPFPEYQRQRRELFDQRRYAEAAALWTPADRNELAVIKALAARRTSRRQSVRAVGKNALSFWISALQSAAFNRVLDRRIDDGAISTLREGDLAWKHDNGAVFRVGAADVIGGALGPRLAALEVSPTGPLWGAGMTRPGSSIAAVETEALEAFSVTLKAVPAIAGRPKGARRPFRVPVYDPVAESGSDEHGPYVRLAYGLPAGAYATIVAGEIMK